MHMYSIAKIRLFQRYLSIVTRKCPKKALSTAGAKRDKKEQEREGQRQVGQSESLAEVSRQNWHLPKKNVWDR